MSTATGERRRFPRRQLAITLSNPVIVTACVLPRAALVRDVCEGGLGVMAAFDAPVGAVLPVWLPGRPGEPSVLILVDVVHVQPPEGDLRHIGTACHDAASAAALCEFLGRICRPET